MDEVQPLPSNSNITQESTSHNSVNTNLEQYRPLYNAVYGGDLDAVNKFLLDQPRAITAAIVSSGDTSLHMAVMFRHLNIVEKLLQLMSVDDLLVIDTFRNTPLHVAVADIKNNEIAKRLVKKNNKMLTMTNIGGWIPLTFAIAYGNTDMVRYLYNITPFDVLKPESGDHGARLLQVCYCCKMFDLALDLLQRCPRLAMTREFSKGTTFLGGLAAMPLKIQDESQLPYWKAWIYKWVHLVQELVSSIKEIPVCIRETNSINDGHTMSTRPGIQNMYQAKLARKQYFEIIRATVKAISPTNEEDLKCGCISLMEAARQGNTEFIVEAIKVEFSLIWTTSIDTGRHIFQLSVEYRQAKVFNLFHGFIPKARFLNFADHDGNNMLHLAGMSTPSTFLNQISGAALQMQRELQWFKEIESIMPPSMSWKSLNHAAKTPRECFTENHKDLQKEGEKWMKGTATSCSVVAALVTTITFAAAFTVPGGSNQDNGYPIFLYDKLFMLFIISDAVSLFSSSTSLLMFLALLTSRYAEDDFLTSLPTKLIIGLSTMFISLATMMIAFCGALFLLIHEKKWIIIPVTLLASVPITLYIWLQLPLLVNMFMSTYRPNIFDRNVKPWP